MSPKSPAPGRPSVASLRGVGAACLAALLASCGGEPIQPPTTASSYTESTHVPFDMVFIPGGGSIKPFWIGKCEVTWDEYQPFCDEYDHPPEGVDAVSRPSPPGHGVPPSGLGSGKQPAMGLQWHAAKQYCEWLSRKTGHAYRLPTEAEWEVACRAGTTTKTYAGDSEAALDAIAWYAGNSDETSHEVGRKKPNAWGLYDMLGNVWEYTSDPYEPGGQKPVLRGGSIADPAALLTASHRQEFMFRWISRDPQRPRSRWWAFDGPVGFRLARSVE